MCSALSPQDCTLIVNINDPDRPVIQLLWQMEYAAKELALSQLAADSQINSYVYTISKSARVNSKSTRKASGHLVDCLPCMGVFSANHCTYYPPIFCYTKLIVSKCRQGGITDINEVLYRQKDLIIMCRKGEQDILTTHAPTCIPL